MKETIRFAGSGFDIPTNAFPRGSIFAGYVPLASQNPYPIIVYFRSILRPILDPMLVTFGHYSQFLGDPIIVSPVVKMGPNPAAHPQ